jgi:branched-chain amino acid transport system ATP-binding protein
MLEVSNLQVRYQGIEALKDIAFHVPSGRIVTLVGANGAGKSTMLRTIAGLTRPCRGSILFKGEEITRRPAHAIAQRGIRLVPEGRRVFPNLTVRENLRMGAYTRPVDEAFKKDLEWVFSVFPRLRDRGQQRGGTLSGGEQQMLALGRALMGSPELLMLDEPSLGLAPQLVEEVFQIIQQINREGKTILLIEQNAWAALDLSDYAYVLETGRIVLEGKGKDLLVDEAVRRAYLGEG